MATQVTVTAQSETQYNVTINTGSEAQAEYWANQSAASAADALQSEQNAATSESNAQSSANNASTSEDNAADSASDAEKHAQETGPFTDSDGVAFDNGAQGFKNQAEAAANNAENIFVNSSGDIDLLRNFPYDEALGRLAAWDNFIRETPADEIIVDNVTENANGLKYRLLDGSTGSVNSLNKKTLGRLMIKWVLLFQI